MKAYTFINVEALNNMNNTSINEGLTVPSNQMMFWTITSLQSKNSI